MGKIGAKSKTCHRCPRTDKLRNAYPIVEEDGRVLDNRAGAMLCPDCHAENDRRLIEIGKLEKEMAK